MNNKGFAITTILYGTLILFCMLLVSLLGILATYRHNLELLVEGVNGDGGTRSIVTLNAENKTNVYQIYQRGLYCIDNECRYYKTPTN